MNFGQRALQVLKTVAPTIALAAGGPFGPIAAAAIHAALGTTDEKSAETALLSATPEQLLALKQADQAFQIRMEELGIQEEQLVYQDIANARAREIAIKDMTPAILAYAVTVGFFGVLGWMLYKGIPSNAGGEALLVMLGSLGTAWAGIVAYFFGSSAGSASKSDALNRIATAKG